MNSTQSTAGCKVKTQRIYTVQTVTVQYIDKSKLH